MASVTGISLFFFFLFLTVTLISQAMSLKCSEKFAGNSEYSQCLDLPTLTASLHFSYNASNASLSVVFTAPPAKPQGWISWAINPTGTGMAGSQAFVAFRDPKTSAVSLKTLNISSYDSLVPSKLAFEVWDTKAEEVSGSGGGMRIFAKVKVPADLAAKGKVNQVWQVGPGVMPNGMIQKHAFIPDNLRSTGELDLSGKQSVAVPDATDSRLRRKNIHGILNALSWGILFPLGAIIARYMRIFESADPAWFYLHVFCQFSAYVTGVAGWGTGLKLGSESKGIHFSSHRNIGIALFALATVQMFALLLRPRKDHKYRFYWNIYHHGVGYSILVLGIYNVFKGLSILNPEHKYKTGYITIIAILGGITVLLEAITWIIVLKRRSGKSTKPLAA